MQIRTRLISALKWLRKPQLELSLADLRLQSERRRLSFGGHAGTVAGEPLRPANFVVCLSLSISVFLLACSATCAQVAGGGDDVATPIPGAGHDYIHLLSETVNPANGTVGVNIKLPTAAGRGISLPFSLIYSSGPANHFSTDSIGDAYFAPDWGGLFRGGWSNSLPLLTFQNWSYPWSPPPHPNTPPVIPVPIAWAHDHWRRRHHHGWHQHGSRHDRDRSRRRRRWDHTAHQGHQATEPDSRRQDGTFHCLTSDLPNPTCQHIKAWTVVKEQAGASVLA